MFTQNTNGVLTFEGKCLGKTLSVNGNFQLSTENTNGTNVEDDSSTDSGTSNPCNSTNCFSEETTPFCGFTISINGKNYAVFENLLDGKFCVPFCNNVEDLSTLEETEVTQNITYTGDDSDVVNLCFLGGTMIATPDGEHLVENLKIGDMVRTAGGPDVAIKWIGRRVVKPALANVALAETQYPVCISAGVLDNHSDLYVSADHGMIVDDNVINASALVNGTTVRFVQASEINDEFTYYHIETEAHDTIFANGAASETFLDHPGRTTFDNHREYYELYGDPPTISEMNRPRISSQRLLPLSVQMRLGIAPMDDMFLLTG